MSTSRVAFVTGAAQGIGEAIALRLADDNINLALFDLKDKEPLLQKVVKAIEAKGRKAVAIEADVTDEPQVVAMIERAAAALGSLDVVRFLIQLFSSYSANTALAGGRKRGCLAHGSSH